MNFRSKLNIQSELGLWGFEIVTRRPWHVSQNAYHFLATLLEGTETPRQLHGVPDRDVSLLSQGPIFCPIYSTPRTQDPESSSRPLRKINIAFTLDPAANKKHKNKKTCSPKRGNSKPEDSACAAVSFIRRKELSRFIKYCGLILDA